MPGLIGLDLVANVCSKCADHTILLAIIRICSYVISPELSSSVTNVCCDAAGCSACSTVLCSPSIPGGGGGSCSLQD
ncbi:hypothetical protein L209DRAFT_375335 [Thermothelomyces heterothallicus CBS 203.75]